MSGLVWLALDGVGHPSDAPPGSPWETDLPTLRPFIDAGLALDATLGVPGLPQSATGQTCWLTGRDAVHVMGEHYGPLPGPTLQPLLMHSLPVRLVQAGARTDILNFYPPGYFERPKVRHGCFPQSFLDAGRPLNPPGLPSISPLLGMQYTAPWGVTNKLDDVRRLGGLVGQAAANHDLLVLDLWFSDFLGHAGRDPLPPHLPEAARAYLTRLDALLAGLLQSGARVVLSSDHGNFENLHVKSHTTARVPFAGVGMDLKAPSTTVDGGRVIAGWFGLP